tara:strand:+ start:1061 stop:1759 length:699 start_codon:yes stop_codon:yes gene_type:complete
MNRLSYLLKNNSNLNIINQYIIYKLKSFFEKRDRKPFVTKYRNFLSTKSLTQDWFSHNIYDWKKILKSFEDLDFNYLEIGSFEGNSAMFILKSYQKARVSCVDAWSQFTKGNEGLPLQIVENNFNDNLKNFENRVTKIKMKSSNFFLKNKKKFDIIYIDGSHSADDVFYDCLESWKILNKKGIIIIDDYFWEGYENPLEDPIHGINKFLTILKKNYLILRVSKYQLFIKKLD